MREKILVIENDQNLRDVLCETLRSEGFPTEGVRDYQQAVALLTERGPYRLAVVNLTTEDGDGEDKAKTIRKKHRTPVVLVAGSKAPRPGVRYVRKPFELEDLLSCVCETLSARVPRGG